MDKEVKKKLMGIIAMAMIFIGGMILISIAACFSFKQAALMALGLTLMLTGMAIAVK